MDKLRNTMRFSRVPGMLLGEGSAPPCLGVEIHQLWPKSSTSTRTPPSTMPCHWKSKGGPGNLDPHYNSLMRKEEKTVGKKRCVSISTQPAQGNSANETPVWLAPALGSSSQHCPA